MPIIDILCYPESVLMSECAPIENIDDEVIDLANSMVETMYSASGIGLAAPQVGVSMNLLIIDIGAQIENGSAIALINPYVTSVDDSEVLEDEGCLSIPGIYANVVRKEAVEVKGMDINEKEVTLELKGLLARAVQHEMDHFNGVLFWDHLGKVKRDMLKQRFKKLQKEKRTDQKKSKKLC
tara:strand:- start:4310 stop:4852 length:543 start_codon:yes stop_codon:yes gene_type:complete